MARPRTVDRRQLIEATAEVIARVGPRFTLAQVAEAAGVSVGSVAGAFGSKHGLLVALSRHGSDRAVTVVREAAARAGNPRDAVRDAVVALFAALGDADSAAHHLAQLGVDLADPALRELLGQHYAVVERELGDLVRAAAGESDAGPEPRRAARVLLAVANGAALDWSIRPRGPLARRLAEDIETTTRSWWT
ncbi:TetR family transcriptional regulator [Saccharomonospora piscinae]|uniref:TetR/AcrR family transcriptional regulator n=1 Tax=Saccharomonospora piscinae TaxID=687388 RepID=UPI001106FB9C|nr:TetR/AcrR family transcriptional regulator [Saccharomonospora piscinae]TLW93306.1 TetR family transcriptional regulator [Saccharomonospora piscinae]